MSLGRLFSGLIFYFLPLFSPPFAGPSPSFFHILYLSLLVGHPKHPPLSPPLLHIPRTQLKRKKRAFFKAQHCHCPFPSPTNYPFGPGLLTTLTHRPTHAQGYCWSRKRPQLKANASPQSDRRANVLLPLPVFGPLIFSLSLPLQLSSQAAGEGKESSDQNSGH